MSQVVFDTIDPAMSGTTLATTLNDFKDALMSGLSGPSRPTELQPGGGWIDTSADPVTWVYRIWTGTDDVSIFSIDLATGISSVALAIEQFSIKKVSADTVGAILNLSKKRDLATNNGQVKSGDVVGEIRWVGRTNTSGNPIVAKIIWTAGEDETSSAYGGTLSIQSVRQGTNTLLEYMKFFNGITEAVQALKINAIRYSVQAYTTVTGDDTTGQIALTAAKSLIEVAGSIALAVRGIDATGNAREITIHNRSSNPVVLYHNDGTATSTNRLFLPSAQNFTIQIGASATLYYSTADTQWKLKSTSEKNFFGFTTNVYTKPNQTFVAPATSTSVRVRGYRNKLAIVPEASAMIDPYGGCYGWGQNTVDQIGDNTIVPKSSPVAVVGAITNFNKIWAVTTSGGSSKFGIGFNGRMYAWGLNTSAQLGVGGVTNTATPTLVQQSLQFAHIYSRENSTWGLTGTGVMYAWGANVNGQLGIGSVTLTSSPTLVSGAQRWVKAAVANGSISSSTTIVAINTSGAAYGFGANLNGQIGDGTVVPKSSPVAVLGGLTFVDVKAFSDGTGFGFLGLTNAGLVYAWGKNTSGELGDGTQVDKSSPVAVLGGISFDSIITHFKNASCFGLTAAGQLYGWGLNDQGQLGLGDTNNRSSPVAVLGGLTFKQVKVFNKSIYAVTTANVLYSWGLNTNGQLGLGDVTSRSSPVAVLGGLSVTDVYAAEGPTDFYSIFAIDVNSVVYAWGQNANGTLALGDVTPRSSPVAILGTVLPDTAENVFNAVVTVTPGQSYPVSVSDAMSYFGTTPLGFFIDRIEVEYL